PIQPVGYSTGMTWSQWLVDDQREASGRPDVATFVSDVLGAPVKISGQPEANLVASTSGTDSDWVVKLIDLYPDEVVPNPALGGRLPKGGAAHLPPARTGKLRRVASGHETLRAYQGPGSVEAALVSPSLPRAT